MASRTSAPLRTSLLSLTPRLSRLNASIENLELPDPASLGLFDPAVVVRDLDMSLIETVRRHWAFYRDRRPTFYGEISAP